VTRWVLGTVVAALIVFAGVQDRLTAEEVGQYVDAYRAAAAAGRPAATIDEVMAPAVRHAVQRGAMWSGAVLVLGLATGVVLRRRRRE
jgi:hypothetical protein